MHRVLRTRRKILISTQAPTGYRVSKGSESHEYGSYTKHDYLIKLAAYLRELAIQSGEDLKMQLDPSVLCDNQPQ